MNDQRIAVLTDSGTDTPQEFVREHDVRVAALHINYSDGSSYHSGVDITSEDVIRRFEDEIPKTSLPSPQEIFDLCEKAKADGYVAGVFVTISSALSATNQTVHMIKGQLEDFPLVVIDTKSIGLIAGMIVMEAARLVEAGCVLDEIEGKLQALSSQSSVYFAVKDLTYLRKGGRISEAVFRLGTMLNIKPVMYCDKDGAYAVIKKARGWEKALATQVKLIKEQAQKFSKVRIGICTSSPSINMSELEERIRLEAPNVKEVIKATLSPDLLVHTGPDMVGMGVVPAED
ncbi:MAG: DegV family protein [Atopobiaceae bacterium]|jgi:DegV family protein with EDD domain